jgi:hypothetical protein
MDLPPILLHPFYLISVFAWFQRDKPARQIKFSCDKKWQLGGVGRPAAFSFGISPFTGRNSPLKSRNVSLFHYLLARLC